MCKHALMTAHLNWKIIFNHRKEIKSGWRALSCTAWMTWTSTLLWRSTMKDLSLQSICRGVRGDKLLFSSRYIHRSYNHEALFKWCCSVHSQSSRGEHVQTPPDKEYCLETWQDFDQTKFSVLLPGLCEVCDRTRLHVCHNNSNTDYNHHRVQPMWLWL